MSAALEKVSEFEQLKWSMIINYKQAKFLQIVGLEHSPLRLKQIIP